MSRTASPRSPKDLFDGLDQVIAVNPQNATHPGISSRTLVSEFTLETVTLTQQANHFCGDVGDLVCQPLLLGGIPVRWVCHAGWFTWDPTRIGLVQVDEKRPEPVPEIDLCRQREND